ncbi:EAL domain-containing protein [Roseibium sp.]|uniref:sensor domain-containing phosphodiesterase n=1 Tax=Roseibium sp. TaxID=1936156 RepID=UPI003A978CBE
MSEVSFPLPEREEERLAQLRSINIVGSPREPEFDAVTKLAASIFDCPIALVSLVEENFQWFKSSVGLDAEETPRSVSFCTHTVFRGEMLVVEDATMDPRFAQNALVTGEPHIRFYAGCPISLDGEHYLGTLCVIDRKPRFPTEAQLTQLRELAMVVEGLMRSFKAVALAHEASWLAHTRNLEISTQNKLLKQVEKLAEVGAFRVNRTTGETVWSEQIFKLHELPVGESLPLEEATKFFPDGERERVLGIVDKGLEENGSFLVDGDFVTAKGRKRRVRFMGEFDADTKGEEIVVGVMHDITAQYEQEQRLWKAANVDALSRLGNRHWFHGELDRVMEKVREDKAEYALLLIDLDGFKLANDSLGHQAGDEVIRVVAERIRETTGEDAIGARIGGDEFAVLVPCGGEVSPRQLAATLVSRIKEAIPFERTSVFVGASIGVAFAPTDADTSGNLMKYADMALYKVKRSGRGRVGYYTKALYRIFGKRQQAVDLVRNAYSSGRIRSHYQPIIDLATLQIRGAEALVRIQAEDGNLLGPDDFWEAFKDPESARLVDSSVFRLVLDDLARWRIEGFDPGCVSINASKYWFQTEDFAAGFLSLLEDRQVPPQMIRLEVTENVLLNEETESVNRILCELRDAGVSIALDDFGAGFASLTHLRDYPIDSIKIDRSFISALARSHQNTLIVRSIVELSRNFDLTVIAGGVENAAQAEFLQAIGCNHAQGSYFGNAVKAGNLHDAMLLDEHDSKRYSYVL